MIEEDRDCVETFLPPAAARAVVDEGSPLRLRPLVETRATEAIRSGRRKRREPKVRERMEGFPRFAGIGGR